jgi:DNA ligase-1
MRKRVTENEKIQFVVIEKCQGEQQLLQQLQDVLGKGGEGLMLRKPESLYLAKRSWTLLKVKVAACGMYN